MSEVSRLAKEVPVIGVTCHPLGRADTATSIVAGLGCEDVSTDAETVKLLLVVMSMYSSGNLMAGEEPVSPVTTT